MGFLLCLLSSFGIATTTMSDHTHLNVKPLAFYRWAETPPMGWNSWDCFGTGVTEALTRENADYMATHLKQHGWRLVTVDIDWFVPHAKGWNYTPNVEVTMDSFGRLLPAVDRFPSAVNGLGFTTLAHDIHARGLLFGVHLLRGIPRKAVERNLPILGTSYRAADIADRKDICPWNPDMYGVDMAKSGAQAYYDSVMKLLAEWGVDFVKIDDLSRPYHTSEIEGIRQAIDKCGRPIVLSTSPGATPLASGEHVSTHANMWRISDDFWDDWGALKEQFERVDHWTPFRAAGHWPDADMLPLGGVRQGQANPWTNFTHPEQVTLMTLWSICRSPLILGGHLPKNDDFTLSLLTNDEVLAVNQHSSGNRQLWRHGDLVAWIADVPRSQDKYLAVFNARDQKQFDFAKAAYSGKVVNRQTPGQAEEIDVDMTGAKRLYLYAAGTEHGNFADHVVWDHPRLIGPAGESLLTDLKWISATQGYGQTANNRSVTGHPLFLDGSAVANGIGTHANSMIVYDVPTGATRFKARAGLEREGVQLAGGATVRFTVWTQDPMTGSSEPTLSVPVDLSDLGFAGSVRVRDLWAGKDLGAFTRTFAPSLEWHGAGLYRLSPTR